MLDKDFYFLFYYKFVFSLFSIEHRKEWSSIKWVLFCCSTKQNLFENLNCFHALCDSHGIRLLKKLPKRWSCWIVNPFLWCNIINLVVLFYWKETFLFACPLCKDKRESFSSYTQKNMNLFQPFFVSFSCFSVLISIWSNRIIQNILFFLG